MTEARNGSGRSSLSTLVVVAAAVAALYFAKQILLPVALAALLGFLLTPLVNRLEGLGLGRVLSVIFAVSCSFAVLSILGWIFLNQVAVLSNQLPEYRRNLIAKVRSVKEAGGKLEEVKKTIEEVGKELTEDADGSGEHSASGVEPSGDRHGWASWFARPASELDTESEKGEAVEVKVVQMPPSPLTQIHDWLGPLVAPMTTGGIVIVLVIFILIQREDIRDRIIQLFGTGNLHTTTEAITDAANRVSRYLRMNLLINASYGIGVGIGLYFIGLPNAVLWGVIGMLLRFLPYIGPWIAASMPILLSLAVFDGWSATLLVVGLFVLLELLVNNVLEPLLYGSSVGVSSLGIVVAAIFWTWVWGPIGLVLAVPLTVCLVVTGRYVPQLRFFTILFSDCSTLSDPERLYQRLLATDTVEAERMIIGYAEKHGIEEVFDRVMIPALELAERDRHNGVLSESSAEFILESTRDLVTVAISAVQADERPSESSSRELSGPVLCIPAGDEADEIVASMLGELLLAVGISAEVGSAESLTSEQADRVTNSGCTVAVISILPPVNHRGGRYLLRRLRANHPTLPIVIGAWQSVSEHKAFELLPKDSFTYVVDTVASAVSRIRGLASRRQSTAVSGGNDDEDE